LCDRGAGGDRVSGAGECLAGFGFSVAVPVAVDDDPAFAEGMQGVAVEGPGHDGGQARGGGAGPDAGQRGAAGGGKRDLAGLDLLPGAAAFAGGGGVAGGGAGQARTSSVPQIQAACSAAISRGCRSGRSGQRRARRR
jgi:hypothetical protein